MPVSIISKPSSGDPELQIQIMMELLSINDAQKGIISNLPMNPVTKTMSTLANKYESYFNSYIGRESLDTKDSLSLLVRDAKTNKLNLLLPIGIFMGVKVCQLW